MDFSVIIPMFGRVYERGKRDGLEMPILTEDPNARYNPGIHDYFTLDGVDEILSLVRGDRFWELVARQKQRLL